MPINTKAYIEEYLKIKTKDAHVVPFKINMPQMKLYNSIKRQKAAGKPVRCIILKARQMGYSTLTEGIGFKETATKKNVKAGIVAHVKDATANLYNMVQRYYDNLPDPIKPALKKSNAKELVYEALGSEIKCMTAGGRGIGRSDTFQFLHVSEYAFWEGKDGKRETILRGLLQAVPDTPDSIVIIESTANGFNEFKDRWDAAVAGESDYDPIFCAWWEDPGYRKPYDGSPLTDDEIKLKERYGLDNEQLAWRRWSIANNCDGDDEYFRQEYPSNPEEAFLVTGRCIFDQETVIQRLEVIKKRAPLKTGRFEFKYDGLHIEGITWVDDPKGCIKVYKAPERRRPYVLGGDTAGEGSDWFTGHVIDNITSVQCAVLALENDEDEYARQMYCLGMYYNGALLSPEINFSTHPVRELERLEYPNLYMRESFDDATHKVQRRYGWRTDQITRPAIIALIKGLVRDYPDCINDVKTLREMLTFIRNAKGRPEALANKHDDHVLGLAIALGSRDQQSFELLEEEDETVDWLESLKDKGGASDMGIGEREVIF